MSWVSVIETFHVGFTGSSERLTGMQVQTLVRMFRTDRAHQRITLHHGDCIVADALAHTIAQNLFWYIEIHPPINEYKRAFCEGANIVHPARDYMDRNDDIARSCSVLIATPDEPDEVHESGTWSTVRRARKYGRRILIIKPDGTSTEELPRASVLL